MYKFVEIMNDLYFITESNVTSVMPLFDLNDRRNPADAFPNTAAESDDVKLLVNLIMVGIDNQSCKRVDAIFSSVR